MWFNLFGSYGLGVCYLDKLSPGLNYIYFINKKTISMIHVNILFKA